MENHHGGPYRQGHYIYHTTRTYRPLYRQDRPGLSGIWYPTTDINITSNESEEEEEEEEEDSDGGSDEEQEQEQVQEEQVQEERVQEQVQEQVQEEDNSQPVSMLLPVLPFAGPGHPDGHFRRALGGVLDFWSDASDNSDDDMPLAHRREGPRGGSHRTVTGGTVPEGGVVVGGMAPEGRGASGSAATEEAVPRAQDAALQGSGAMAPVIDLSDLDLLDIWLLSDFDLRDFQLPDVGGPGRVSSGGHLSELRWVVCWVHEVFSFV